MIPTCSTTTINGSSLNMRRFTGNGFESPYSAGVNHGAEREGKMEEGDSRPYNLVSQAVDLACERNPRLALEPYYQMKSATLILAEMLIGQGFTELKASGDPR